MNNTIFIFSFLFAVILYGCQKHDVNPQNAQLVKETYFAETKDSASTGFKSYEYDNRGNLVLENTNDILFIEYIYDSRDSLIEKVRKRDDGFILTTTFTFSSPLEKTGIRIRDHNDTLDVIEYKYNGLGQLIEESKFRKPIHFFQPQTIRLSHTIHYAYYDKGELKSKTTENFYYDDQNKIIDTSFVVHQYDDYGNLSKITFKQNGQVTDENNYVNNYENNLLVEHYLTPSKHEYIRYEYDEKGRLKRAYDREDYLIRERFYENGLLVEEHNYVPDNFDGIPDAKSITVFEYQY